MNDRHEALILELASELQPVERLSTLRRVGAAVVGAALVNACLFLGIPLALGTPVESQTAAELWTLAALLMLASGGLAFALASSIPGRFQVERAGLVVLAVGVAVAAAGAPALRGAGLERIEAAWLAGTGVCTVAATLLAIFPAAILLRFAARAEPFRPAWTLAFGGLGALALGALPVRIACSFQGPLHALVAHLLAPLTGGLLLFLGLQLLYQRRLRLSERRSV